MRHRKTDCPLPDLHHQLGIDMKSMPRGKRNQQGRLAWGQIKLESFSVPFDLAPRRLHAAAVSLVLLLRVGYRHTTVARLNV